MREAAFQDNEEITDVYPVAWKLSHQLRRSDIEKSLRNAA